MMLNKLRQTANSPYYWLLLIATGIAFEAVALYYQYVLEEPPCVLCIQVRLLVAAMMIIAVLILLMRRLLPAMAGHVMMSVIAISLLERSYQLLGNERGFIIGLCGIDLGLPAWFTPDVWWPTVFEVQTTCGYTPELVLGITMAEALIVISSVFVVLSTTLLLLSFKAGEKNGS